MSFEIKLPLFEGPFDLLLFFIEKKEIDIYDIPISQITEEFLAYIHQLEDMNIEVASEFIVVAATLMRIKSRMLLPVEKEKDEDPRQELVDYLLEYKKYKSVLGVFERLEEVQLMQERRGNVLHELHQIAGQQEVEMELQNLDIYKLLKVYERALQTFEERSQKVSHQVLPFPYTVAGQKESLMQELEKQKKLNFQEIIITFKSKIAAIYNFLAILELLQNRLITLQLEKGFNNFWIEKGKQETEAPKVVLNA